MCSRYEEHGKGTLPPHDKPRLEGQTAGDPGRRVKTRQRVSDVLQLTGALRRSRQPLFRINNLTNGKPAWVLIRFHLNEAAGKDGQRRVFFFLGFLQLDFSALIIVSSLPNKMLFFAEPKHSELSTRAAPTAEVGVV